MDTPHVAIIYHSQEGHTAEVARYIALRLKDGGAEATVFDCHDAPADLRAYQGVIVGGSIHFGHHHKDLERFVLQHRADIEHLPNAFFSVGLNAGSQDPSRRTMAQDFVSQFIAETGWHPDMVSLVGGALRYTRYGWVKRQMLKKIASDFEGAKDTRHDHVYTHWEDLDQFAIDFLAQVRPEAPAIPHYRVPTPH